MDDDNPGVEKSGQILWLEKEIVPQIEKALDKGVGNSSCKIELLTSGVFISAVYMVDLTFYCSADHAEDERIELVVKMPPENESARDLYGTDLIFRNEISFYKRFGRHYDHIPKCVFADSEPITRAVLVLENVTQFGYKSMQSKEDLGTKRALAAVREIGKFHAQGYVLKEQNPKEFFEVVKELRENMFGDSAHPAMIQWINGVSVRPVNYLRSANYDPEFCDKISIFLSNSHEKIFKDCVKPRNELAVICHGDFISNNVLFKESDGKFKAMLIDFAQLRYASPATDLSNFLYLSCEDEVRKNFPDIFRAYHDTVLEYLREHGVQDLGRYSFDAFLKDFKRHAVFGCGLAISFTPEFHLDYQLDFDDIVKNISNHVENMMVSGGERVSKKLADLLLELKDNGCLDHMI